MTERFADRVTTPECQTIRLVTITHHFPARGGGIELVAGKLVEEFIARGVQVEWFSSETAEPPALAPNLRAIPVRTSNVIERLTQLPYPLWGLSTIPRLWSSIGRAHIVHIHEHLYVGSVMAAVIARLRKRPIIITQHTGTQGLGNRWFILAYQMIVRLLGTVMFRMAERTVFISANVRDFYSLGSNHRARLIFNGIDVDQFGPVPPQRRQSLRSRLGLPTDRQLVLFVGRFVRKKGMPIVEALTGMFPRVEWVFVGFGPENPADWRRPNVRVPGRLGHEELSRYYQSCDLLFLPSFSEGFPLVVQEALACGLGVLSTDEVATACPEARKLIRSVPILRGDAAIEEWHRALSSALSDVDYLDARAARADEARRLWSWARCTTDYLAMFADIRCRNSSVSQATSSHS